MTPRMLAFALAFLAAAAAHAFPPQGKNADNHIFAQKLIDEFTADNLDLISVGVHAKDPRTNKHIIIASTLPGVGKESEQEDFDVLAANKPHEPFILWGGIYDIIIPLHDASGKNIGTAHFHVKPDWHRGDPMAESMRLAIKYRDEFAKRISSEDKLFEPTTP